MPNQTLKPPSAANRLRFEDGFWLFSCPFTGDRKRISALMREMKFDSDDLSNALGLGKRTFHRIVKDSLDTSPGVWLRRERAVEMRQLLRSGRSIKELSAHYGFKHPGDFCVEFKRWHRVSPSRFVADMRRNCFPL